jgi:enamidase
MRLTLVLQLLAITHATVIDMTGAAPRRDATVLIDGARIVSVGPAARARVPSGARVVDGRGKVSIPGLRDMHVHLTFPDAETRRAVGLLAAVRRHAREGR